jgi:F-type H+-transporting ATPase subunit a
VLIASVNLLEHVLDCPWPGWGIDVLGVHITLMSGAIISMWLVGAALIAIIVPMARRCRYVPSGGQNFLEALVVFVRDVIARPALHEKADAYLPFLTTVFVVVFSMNLVGLLPLESISLMLGVNDAYRVGGTPTAVPAVGAALASLAMLAIVANGLRTAAEQYHHRRGWPMSTCWALSPVLWFLSLSPPVPGLVGKAILVPMALLELISAVAKCVALLVRLCANMVAGHMLLAVVVDLGLKAIRPMLAFSPGDPGFHAHGIYVLPICIVGSVALNLMELLICGIQAFIFTIMTALFLGMYAEASHG